MKIHLFFEIIAAFMLILQPTTAHFDGNFSIDIFPPQLILFYIVVTGIACLRSRYLPETATTPEAGSVLRFWQKGALTILTTGFLLGNAMLWGKIAEAKGFHINVSSLIENTQTWQVHANIVLGTIAAAFFEEALYRLYTPRLTLHFWTLLLHARERQYLVAQAITEILIVFIFALGHRYGGWPSVMNALCAGAALRLLVRHTKSILYAACAHAVFNLTQFIPLLG